MRSDGHGLNSFEETEEWSLEEMRRALNEMIAVESCFNGRYWDSDVVCLDCHRLMALRPNLKHWNTVVMEPIWKCVGKLKTEAMRTNYQGDGRHSRLLMGGEFVLGEAAVRGRRYASHRIILPAMAMAMAMAMVMAMAMAMAKFSRSDWDQKDFSPTHRRCYIQISAVWAVWDSCAAVAILVGPVLLVIGEGRKLVVFQMPIGKRHRLDQSHFNFYYIKSHRHSISELRLLFLFVPDESFSSFKIVMA
jgi:hypothetical protein